MKKLILAVAIMATGTAAFAQKDEAKPNIVKVNPLGLVFGAATVAYERALSEKSSIVLAPSFGGYKLAGFKYSSYGFGGEYRFYLSNTKSAPAGFYAGPGVGFTTGKIKVDGSSTEAKFTSFGGKAIIGNQWVWSSGFVLDLNGGIQYSSYSYKDNENSIFTGLKASGIFPALGFSLGYNF